MRLTVSVGDDVHAEMERLRREEGLGPSEALNLPPRRGMTAHRPHVEYVHKSYPLGLKMDVSNVGEVLARLDAADP